MAAEVAEVGRRPARFSDGCAVPKLCSHRGIIPICRRNRMLTSHTDYAEKLRGWASDGSALPTLETCASLWVLNAASMSGEAGEFRKGVGFATYRSRNPSACREIVF